MVRRYLPLGLIGLGVILLVSSALYLAFTVALNNPAAIGVPQELAGLKLTQQEQGPAAVSDIAQLHAKDFPLISGAMAVYGKGGARLWVSGVPAAPMAAGMVRDMRDKIAQGRSPFQPLETRAVANRTVYALEGMGQRHFYFQSGALVIWLAVDSVLAEQALRETMSFYP